MARAPSWRWGELQLTPLFRASAPALADYHKRNRERLRPFSPTRTDAFYSDGFWRSVKRRARAAARAETAIRWALETQAGDEVLVIGLAGLDQIVRGAFQSASLGYSIDAAYEGRGFMKQACIRILAYAFDDLRLHRVSADYVPDNERSAALLASLGFEREGYAKDYLKLDGVWRDHVMTALRAPDMKDKLGRC